MTNPHNERERPLASAEELVQSSRYLQLVADFTTTTGLAIHAYTQTAVPLTLINQPAEFCQSLQGGLDCPLYFDPAYHVATGPEVRDTCAGLGHVLIPVIDGDGNQVLNLVSDSCRLGPVDMERLTHLSFKLKIFPDQLVAQAEMVPLVARARLLFAAQILFAGLHELSSGAGARADALSVLARRVAEAPADGIPLALVEAVREFTGADYAYVCMVDESGARTCDAALPAIPGAGAHGMLAGLADWCIHASERVEVPDVAESAWCQHLAGGAASAGAVVGVPLVARDTVFGSIVVGGANRRHLADWSTALATLVDAGRDALVLARRLVETSGGGLVDVKSGAYNLNFLQELLEKEISRAGRHNHELSLVFFRAENYSQLVGLGGGAAEAALAQMVELMKNRTRKVNSLARVSETDFCLVIPEAGREVAEKIAHELESATESETFSVDVNGGKDRINIKLSTRTVSNPRATDALVVPVAGAGLVRN